MDDYTPTTEEVRNNMALGVCFAYMHPPEAVDIDWPAPGAREAGKAIFDRWLAARDREVAERAWDEGVKYGSGYVMRHPTFDYPVKDNPYRLAPSSPIGEESD